MVAHIPASPAAGRGGWDHGTQTLFAGRGRRRTPKALGIQAPWFRAWLGIATPHFALGSAIHQVGDLRQMSASLKLRVLICGMGIITEPA